MGGVATEDLPNGDLMVGHWVLQAGQAGPSWTTSLRGVSAGDRQ